MMTPEEVAYQQKLLTRRQQVAQSLAQSAMTDPQSWGNDKFRHSPIEGVAKVLQAYMANKAGKAADTAGADLSKTVGNYGAQATQDYQNATAPSPAVPLAAGGGQIDEVPLTETDKRGAIAKALMNPYASEGLQNVAKLDYQSMEGDKTRAENLQAKKDQQAQELDVRRQQIEAQMADRAATREQQSVLARQHDETLKALASLRGQQAGAGNERKDRAQVMQLRKEFDALQPVQNYRLVLPTYERALTAPNTRAGDLSVVYALGKIFDPNSVVREGELTLSKDAQPWLKKIVQGAQSQITGKGALDAETRKTITEAMKGQVDSLKTQYSGFRNQYSQYAKGMDTDPFDVVGDEPKINVPETPVATPAGGAFSDPEKEKRYQAWKAAHPNG